MLCLGRHSSVTEILLERPLTRKALPSYNVYDSNGKGVFFMTNAKKERGRIGRRIQMCHCKGKTIAKGKLIDFEYDLYGDYSDPVKATNTLRQRLGDSFISITSVETESDYYSIPIRLFLKVAMNYAIGKEPHYD